MIVDCAHYRDGVRQKESPIDIPEAAECGASGDGFVWLGIQDPTEEELEQLRTQFGLHELAVEDARAEHQRAKMETYGDTRFVVLRTARYLETEEQVEFGEIHLFAGPRFAVTVRHGEASALHDVRRRMESRPELLTGPIAVVWAVIDKVVDDYEPVVEGVAGDIEEVEVRVFEGQSDQTQRIYFLKREVIEFYRAVHPLLAPLAAIERGADPLIGNEMRTYFRDVNDHVKLVHEEIASHREILTSILEANLAVLSAEQNEISLRQNENMKQLSTIATVFLPLAFIVGFFGQNFGWLVGQVNSFTDFLLWGLGSLVVSSAVLFALFKRSGYL
jgi:magnesium transporter